MAWSLKRNADGSLARDAMNGTLCACAAGQWYLTLDGNVIFYLENEAPSLVFTSQTITEDAGYTAYAPPTLTDAYFTIEAISASSYFEVWTSSYNAIYRLSYTPQSGVTQVDPAGTYDLISGDAGAPSTIAIGWEAVV
jgi:hypothetical protein